MLKMKLLCRWNGWIRSELSADNHTSNFRFQGTQSNRSSRDEWSTGMERFVFAWWRRACGLRLITCSQGSFKCKGKDRVGGRSWWRTSGSRCLRLCLQIDRPGAFVTAAGGLFGDIRDAGAGKGHTVRVPPPRARPCRAGNGRYGQSRWRCYGANRTGKVMLGRCSFSGLICNPR